MQSAFQEPNQENNMTQERMTRHLRQLEEEELLAEMQASEGQLNHSLGGGKYLAEGTKSGS